MCMCLSLTQRPMSTPPSIGGNAEVIVGRLVEDTCISDLLCDDELVPGAYEQSGLQFGVPDYGNQDGDTQLRLTEDPRSLLPCVI